MQQNSYLHIKNSGNSDNGFDPNFKYEIISQPGGENILKCYQCGTCTGICPIFEIDEDFHPQKIIKMALLGMRHEVLSSEQIWLCSTCYSCYEHCPQDVKVTDLMCAIQNIATREGYLAPALGDKINLLKEHARTLPIDDFDNKKRSKFNLPSIVENPGDVASIIEKTGIEKLVENTKHQVKINNQENPSDQVAQDGLSPDSPDNPEGHEAQNDQNTQNNQNIMEQKNSANETRIEGNVENIENPVERV
jgi:heterodisulfide reductase subunit C